MAVRVLIILDEDNRFLSHLPDAYVFFGNAVLSQRNTSFFQIPFKAKHFYRLNHASNYHFVCVSRSRDFDTLV